MQRLAIGTLVLLFAATAQAEVPVPPAELEPASVPVTTFVRSVDETEQLRARLERLEALAASAPAPSSTQPKPQLLKPSVLAEFDYKKFSSDLEGNSGFALARLRPGLRLAPTTWFTGVAAFEFAGEYATIVDGYMKLRANETIGFTFGYSKPPVFASFAHESIHTLPFPDRAPVVSSFGVSRDAGVDVHLTPQTVPIEATVRVGNGTGSPLGNDNALPAGYASLDLVLGRAWVGASQDSHSFGLRLGAGGFIESAQDRDGIVGKTPFGFVYARPVVVSGLRMVGEGHMVAYAGPVRVTIEAAVAHESRSRDDDGNPATPRVALPTMKSYGLTTEVAWVVRGVARDVGKTPRATAESDSQWSGGAVEIAARYDGMWLGRGASDVRESGAQGGSLAIQWWPVDDFFALSLSSNVTHYGVAPIEDPTARWSLGIAGRASFYWGLGQ